MHGVLLVPIILGSDKTTVSVATGHNEYWPLYASTGNIDNNVRHAHGAGLILVGFLSIPKGTFFSALVATIQVPWSFLVSWQGSSWNCWVSTVLEKAIPHLIVTHIGITLRWWKDTWGLSMSWWTLSTGNLAHQTIYSWLPWAGIVDMHHTRLVSSVSHPGIYALLYSSHLPL